MLIQTSTIGLQIQSNGKLKGFNFDSSIRQVLTIQYQLNWSKYVCQIISAQIFIKWQYYSVMSYRLEGTTQIKNLFPRIGYIPGFSPGVAIHVSNNQHSFYTIYHPDPQQQPHRLKMSQDFLTLNNIAEGFYNIKSSLAKNVRSLKVEVSKLHWDIIGDRVSVIERQFFNQAKLVWNGLIVPLYYNELCKVDLKCCCEEGVWELTQNSQLHIQYIRETKQQQQDQQQLHPMQQFIADIQEQIGIEARGYGNMLYIAQQTIKKYSLQEQKYYQLTACEQNTNNLQSFKSFINSKTNQHIIPSPQIIYAKLKIIHQPLISAISDQDSTLFASRFFISNFNIDSLFRVQDKFQETQSHIIMSNEYFLSSQNKIHVFFIPTSQSNNVPKLDHLYSQILNSSVIFYNEKLFKLGEQFYLTRIQKFDKQSNTTSPVKLLKINSIKVFKQNEIKKEHERIQKKIRVAKYSMYLSNTNQIQKAKYSSMISSHLQSSIQKQSTNTLFMLFEKCYSSEINQILETIQRGQNILITSINKNGKTLLQKYLSQKKKLKVFYVDFEEISTNSDKIKDILEYLELVFQEYNHRIIYIDNVHYLCKSIQNDMHRQNQIIASKVTSRHIKEFIETFCKKSVILTSTSTDVIEDQLMQLDLNQIYLKNPSGEVKRDIIGGLIKDTEKVNQISKHIQGMSFGQMISKISSKEKIQNFFSSEVLKMGGKEQEVNDFRKVAGLNIAKKIITQTIQTPFKYFSLYKNLDIKLPRGVLLYGPSGVGKTYLANAVKDQMKIKFFQIKGSDILNKYIGASEQAVRDIFERAASVSPSVIFFDEFQSIVPKRNADNTGVNDRVVNQFLCYLDGVSSIQGVFIIAASSRPQMIDPALLRPGRIDKHIYLQYPNEEERRQVLVMFQKSIEFEFDNEQVIKRTVNYSYSDIIGLIKELRIKKSNEVVKSEKVDVKQFKTISFEFFDKIQSSYRVAVPIKQQERQALKFKKFANKEPDDIKNQKTMLA